MVNVVDLRKLQSPRERPDGLSDRDYDRPFTTHKTFTYRRTNRKFDMRAEGNDLKQAMADQLAAQAAT